MINKKILIIDQDAISRKFLAHTFKERGCVILQAESGREGVILALRDYPDAIILDPNLPDLNGDKLIRKLRQDQRTAKTPIIALSSDPDPIVLSACQDEGCNEYLLKSGDAIEKLLAHTSRLLGSKPKVKKKEPGMLIVFFSAKGGVGTSSLCANTAMHITEQEPESKVAVVDMVLPIGSIARTVGYRGSVNLSTLTDIPPEQITPEFLRETLPTTGSWGFQLLAGSPDPEAANLLQVKHIPAILSALLEAYAYVLVDLGRALSRISLPILQQADLLIPIVSTDRNTVKLTKTVLDYLRAQDIQPQRFHTVINRIVGAEGLNKNAIESELGLQVFATMPYMSENMTLANSHCEPISHRFPHDTASVVLKNMAQNISRLHTSCYTNQNDTFHSS
ncbi:MAG: response regulator [Anaerolineales bacterium]|nr:response regulator [Anaerolineales bacterium]